MSRRVRHWEAAATGVLCLALGAACGGSAPSTGAAVRDSLGITIVEHRTFAGNGVPLLQLDTVPGVRIGVTEGAETYQFFRVTDALRRRDGSIVVLDRSRTIRAYDGAGVHLWTAGRSGDGPGEFRTTQHVSELPGDTLAVWDSGSGRLSLFTAAGQFVRSWTIQGMAGVALMQGVADDDRVLLERRILARGAVDGHNALTIHSELHLFDVSERADTTLGRRLTAIEFQEVDENGAYSPAIFGTAAVYAPAPAGFWYGDTESSELQRTTAAGALTIVRWPGQTVPVRDADVNAVVEKWASEPDATPALRQFLGQYQRTHPRAERFPSYEEIRVDSDGALWIRDYVRAHEDDGVRRWLVFSPDGRTVLGRLEHRANLRPLRMSLEGILGVEQDELGVERIVYRCVTR